MSGSRNSRHRQRTPTASPKPATIRPDLRRARRLVIADTDIYGGDGVPQAARIVIRHPFNPAPHPQHHRWLALGNGLAHDPEPSRCGHAHSNFGQRASRKTRCRSPHQLRRLDAVAAIKNQVSCSGKPCGLARGSGCAIGVMSLVLARWQTWSRTG